MGTRRAALHLGLFEQPGRERVFQHPAKRRRRSSRQRNPLLPVPRCAFVGEPRRTRTEQPVWRPPSFRLLRLTPSNSFDTLPSEASHSCIWWESRSPTSLPAHIRPPGRYSAARNSGYTFARAASFAGKALALAQGPPKVLGPPRGPFREGRAAAPPRTLPRTVRSRVDCRLSSAPHSRSAVFPRAHTEPLSVSPPRTAGCDAETRYSIGR